jgi:hypothetical protein
LNKKSVFSIDDLIDFMRPANIVGEAVQEDGYRTPLICTCCSSKVNSTSEFALVWEDESGMCNQCVTDFRTRAGYYKPSELKKRAASDLRFANTAKRIEKNRADRLAKNKPRRNRCVARPLKIVSKRQSGV